MRLFDPLMLILRCGTEEYSGLWEAIYELKSYRPDIQEIERRTVAETIMKELLSRNWVRLHKLPIDSTTLDGFQPLFREEHEEMLSDPKNWKPPVDSDKQISIWFEATEEGEETFSQMVGRS